MKPIDVYDARLLAPENAARYLSAADYADFGALSRATQEQYLRELLDRPIARFTVVNEVYFRQKWAALIHRLYGAGPITLLEVASGDADMIPQALNRSNPGSVYITANMNHLLNESMLARTRDLVDLRFELIDDDAANIRAHVGAEAVDLIAFQHGVNDVIQAILCAQAGIDTIYADWMETLPAMIRLLQEEVEAGTLEAHVKPAFLQLWRDLLHVLKSGGVMAMHHYMFQLDLDWGYPPALFENIIPMVRGWAAELEDCREVTYEGFEGQWWLFLKKDSAGPRPARREWLVQKRRPWGAPRPVCIRGRMAGLSLGRRPVAQGKRRMAGRNTSTPAKAAATTRPWTTYTGTRPVMSAARPAGRVPSGGRPQSIM